MRAFHILYILDLNGWCTVTGHMNIKNNHLNTLSTIDKDSFHLWDHKWKGPHFSSRPLMLQLSGRCRSTGVADGTSRRLCHHQLHIPQRGRRPNQILLQTKWGRSVQNFDRSTHFRLHKTIQVFFEGPWRAGSLHCDNVHADQGRCWTIPLCSANS